MARGPRSIDRWHALSEGNKRRWRGAFGGEEAAREAYVAGAHLTTAQRGHRWTPNEPAEALARPQDYPGYIARHTDELNEIARQRGLAEHGTGPRGTAAKSYREAGDYTWEVPDGTLSLDDWRLNRTFRSREEAQMWARKSWAPAGVVMIQDRGPGHIWRWEVWFGYAEARTRTYRGRAHMASPAMTRADNITRIREFLDSGG